MTDAAPVQQHQPQQQQQPQLPQHQQQQQIRSQLEQQQLQHYQLQQQQHQQQHQEKAEAPASAAAAAASALPAVSEAHSSQGVPSQQAKLSHHVQQPATAAKASPATQVNANATATTPRPGPQASAQPTVGLKQPPPKKEKIPCLFCTKPARSTCPFKLCKKCCNERHPNDCKAHDSGPAANSVKPADKPKSVKPQPVPVAPVEAVASAVHTTAHQLPALVGPPELTPVTAGPDTFDLTKTVADFHKERAAVTAWQTHVQLGLEKQHHDAFSQACDRYTENAQLMKLLCSNEQPNSLTAEADPADIKRRKLWLVEAAADAPSQAITGDLGADSQSSGLSATPAGLPVRTTCFVL